MNTPFDTDLDAFLNYDQNDQTPMSSSSDVKPIPALLHQGSDFSSTFSGPSYQYDSHRQQTGLPMGGYANTLAVNQATGLHYRPGNNFIVPTETLNIPLSNLDDFDFNRPQFDQADMDFENDSPADVPSMFYGADGQSNVSPASQIPPRIYPGMHTQQANQAKIQQVQKQQEMMRQQQQRQLPAGQQPLPTGTPTAQKAVPAAKDPHVEESISRLLNRMRQSSSASADDDDADSPGGSNMPRIKRDEDEMDDDERLLNSEEGKKLSSKERRQLRNKVSARAFRSRRKEYITQLEAEVAQKAQESNELRVQNRQLMEENTRLTDLTRMLLSSQAFSGFLSELSNSGVTNTMQQQSSQQQQQGQQQQQTSKQSQPQQQQQPQQARKDVSSHEAARQMQMQNQNNQMQVGMTLIPDTPIDMSVFDGHTSWNNMVPSSDYQVFAVTELPEPPKLDLSSITEKSSEIKPIRSSKKDLPVVSSIPTPPSPIKSYSPVDQSDDLYAEDSTVPVSLPTTLYTTLSKAAVSSDILSSVSPSTGSWSDLQQLCEEMDETCDRISQFTC